MKKLVALTMGGVMLAASALFFAACGDGEQKTADGRTTVHFWCQTFTETETLSWVQDKVDEFNESDVSKEGGFAIKVTFVSEDAWEQTLKAAQSTGTAPEISTVNYAEVALNSVEGYYTALDGVMSESCFTDLLPNVEEMTNVSGSHYIYPWFVEPDAILFYRKSALAAAGLDAAELTSWEDMYTFAKTIKAETDYEYGIAMPNSSQLGWVLWSFQAQDKNSLGYYMLDDNWSRAEVNTSFHRQLFELFKKMYDEELTPAVALSSYNEITPLAEGDVPMAIGGSWSIGQIKNNYPAVLDDIGYVVLPTVDGVTEGVTTTALGGWGLVIDGRAKHPEECGAFIEWLLGSDTTHLEEFMAALGYSKFAARTSVQTALAETPEASGDAFYNFVSESILPYAKAEPAYLWEISRKYADALETVTQLGKDVVSTLATLETDLNNLIEAEALAGTNPFHKQ